MNCAFNELAPPCEALKEGWLRTKKNVTLPLKAQTGWFFKVTQSARTTPSALFSVALHFLLGQPPLLKRFGWLALFLAAPLLAQQRPLLTEDPRTISDGTLVTELGFAYLNRARFPVSGLEGDEFSFLVNSINVGLGSRGEFQISGVAHNFLWTKTTRRNDWGDFSVSTKIKLVKEARRRPIVTFRTTVTLPNTNNEKGLGTDGTHFFGSLLFGKTAGPVFVFGNLGLGILDDAVRAAAQQDVLTYGLAASLRLNSRLNLLGEVNGWRNPQENPSPGGEDRGQARMGLQIRGGGLRWDVGATAGTTRWDHKTGLVFGFTKEFRLWQ